MEYSSGPVPGAGAELPDKAEIVANLWYVMDYDDGFIYSLRIMLYVAGGSDEEKLALLRSRAYLDYLVARPFPIPNRFRTTFRNPSGKDVEKPVVHHDSMRSLGGVDQLFFDGLDVMKKDLPAQTSLTIPESPLTKVTALVGLPNGDVIPYDAVNTR